MLVGAELGMLMLRLVENMLFAVAVPFMLEKVKVVSGGPPQALRAMDSGEP